MGRMVWLGLAAFLLLTGPAGAAELKDLLAAAGSQAQEGRSLEALATLRQALAQIWREMPLTVKKAVLVSEKAPSFGSYRPREGNSFKAGEPILLYLEPVGYRFKPLDGGHQFGLACDLTVLSEEGKILGGQRDFGQWSFDSRELIFDFFMNLTINLTGLPAGRYLIEITLRDLNSTESARVQTPVVLR